MRILLARGSDKSSKGLDIGKDQTNQSLFRQLLNGFLAQSLRQILLRAHGFYLGIPLLAHKLLFFVVIKLEPGKRVDSSMTTYIVITQGRTGYLSTGHMSKHMLIGGINALPYSSHMPTVHI